MKSFNDFISTISDDEFVEIINKSAEDASSLENTNLMGKIESASMF